MIPIIDGTGKGYVAQVDSDNRLLTKTVQISEYDLQSDAGKAFNINTEFISFTGSAETPIIYVKNNAEQDAVLANFFIGTGNAGGTPTEQGLIKAYFNATSVSGGETFSAANRRAGAPETFEDFTILRHDNATPIVATYSSITPILYQTQGAPARTFGTIFLVLAKGQSITITYTPNGAQTVNIYAGFGGYLKPANGG